MDDLNIEFEIHGAACSACDAKIMVTYHCAQSHTLLRAFTADHKTHEGFAFVVKVAKPKELFNDEFLELKVKGNNGL